MIFIKNDLYNKIKKLINSEGFLIPDKGCGSVGLLLEEKLGLTNNEFPVADCDGIELKTSNIYSEYPITLFSCTLDGPDFYPLSSFVERFGKLDDKYPQTKVLYIRLSSTQYSNWGKFIKMRLIVDRKKEKIYILVLHANGKVIEKRVFWDFKTLESVIKRKISSMYFITYHVRRINNKKYCFFDDILVLKAKTFEDFLECLEQGKIDVYIKSGVFSSGLKEGKAYNHGTAFQIKKHMLLHMFEQKK